VNELLLFFGLFFPRLSLLVAWMGGAIPMNMVPFWMEVVLTAIFPRLLIIFYAGTTLGWSSGWVIAHIIAWALVGWRVFFPKNED
jgi:hypothetical protein